VISGGSEAHDLGSAKKIEKGSLEVLLLVDLVKRREMHSEKEAPKITLGEALSRALISSSETNLAETFYMSGMSRRGAISVVSNLGGIATGLASSYGTQRLPSAGAFRQQGAS
jgi:hypothetical protein